MIAYWRQMATKRLLPGGDVPKSHVAKLCQENGFHSRRKTILAPGPALGSTGRLTRHPEIIRFPSLSRSGSGKSSRVHGIAWSTRQNAVLANRARDHVIQHR